MQMEFREYIERGLRGFRKMQGYRQEKDGWRVQEGTGDEEGWVAGTRGDRV